MTRHLVHLVPKLQLGNALVFDAPLRQRSKGSYGVNHEHHSPCRRLRLKQSFKDNGIPKLELGNEGKFQ
jgi:hypothetical protein